ncbi:MAG: Holliday junction resolvase RuvX [Candidatus Acidiferrales bacterium]
MVSSTRAAGAAFPARLLSKPARILAIDYGRRRIGLAISDELGLTAQPLATMERKNRREDLRRLRDLAKTNGVRAILVGSPVHLSGRRSEMAEEAARFAGRVQEELGLPVELRDERLTSWEAAQMAGELGMGKNADIDSLAAAILLREYLGEAQSRRKSKRPVRAQCEK